MNEIVKLIKELEANYVARLYYLRKFNFELVIEFKRSNNLITESLAPFLRSKGFVIRDRPNVIEAIQNITEPTPKDIAPFIPLLRANFITKEIDNFRAPQLEFEYKYTVGIICSIIYGTIDNRNLVINKFKELTGISINVGE